MLGMLRPMSICSRIRSGKRVLVAENPDVYKIVCDIIIDSTPEDTPGDGSSRRVDHSIVKPSYVVYRALWWLAVSKSVTWAVRRTDPDYSNTQNPGFDIDDSVKRLTFYREVPERGWVSLHGLFWFEGMREETPRKFSPRHILEVGSPCRLQFLASR